MDSRLDGVGTGVAISRQVAITQQLRHYTGKPCKLNHTLRYTTNKSCVNCTIARRAQNVESSRASVRKWHKNNRGRCNAMTMKYKAAKLQATPSWADYKTISALYERCPEGWDVDHEIPLQGLNVCGLHVLANLQYLPRLENQRKGNKYAGQH